MKTRPILFSGSMVRALLAGTKTQTRRIVKIQPPPGVQTQFASIYCGPDVQSDPRPVFAWRRPGWFDIETQYCPYGQPGDRLWVRETWRLGESNPNGLCVSQYEVEDGQAHWRVPGPPEYQALSKRAKSGKRVPGIHMPRWASRLTLEITDVRVERLEAISEADALAEGITCENVIVETRYEGGGHREITADRFFFDGGEDEGYQSAVDAYAELWEKINGAGSWDANPWVWCIAFRAVKP